jgi:hydrogenase maturation protease
MSPAILVAGVGNIFLGDDAFGVEVARSLATRHLPVGVLVKDFGIRGFDLAYALLDPWNTVILVDALPRGEAPGTLYLLEPNLDGLGTSAASSAHAEINPHAMDPVRVLNLAASMGTISARVLVVGCEPNDFGEELEGRMGLSPPVQAAVEGAAKMVEELVGRILSEHGTSPAQLEMTEVRL